MNKRLFVLLWIAAILTPLAWMRQAWGLLRLGFNTALEMEIFRIVGHATLFAGLVFLLGISLNLPRTWKTGFMLLGITLLVGMGQEGLQVISAGRAPGMLELFDLGVDLTGGMMGLGIYWMWVALERPFKWLFM